MCASLDALNVFIGGILMKADPVEESVNIIGMTMWTMTRSDFIGQFHCLVRDRINCSSFIKWVTREFGDIQNSRCLKIHTKKNDEEFSPHTRTAKKSIGGYDIHSFLTAFFVLINIYSIMSCRHNKRDVNLSSNKMMEEWLWVSEGMSTIFNANCFSCIQLRLLLFV